MPTFVLSGLSKMAGLPQMKAAWIACFAAPRRCTPGSHLRHLPLHERPHSMRTSRLAESPAQQPGQIKLRLQANLATLDAILSAEPGSRLAVEAGWYAVLRVPGLQPEEQTALDLLEQRCGGGPSGWFFWFFRSGMAGRQPACAAGGIPKGRRDDSKAF